MQLTEDLSHAVLLACDEFDLPVPLVMAIVITESAGNPFAWRVEPFYRWLFNPLTRTPFRARRSSTLTPPEAFQGLPGRSRVTAWIGQKTSWGPMQIMGAVARELGFKGWFTELCTPGLGMRYGCMHLARVRDRFFPRYGWDGVIAAYNAGSVRMRDGAFVNQRYVNKVRTHMRGHV